MLVVNSVDRKRRVTEARSVSGKSTKTPPTAPQTAGLREAGAILDQTRLIYFDILLHTGRSSRRLRSCGAFQSFNPSSEAAHTAAFRVPFLEKSTLCRWQRASSAYRLVFCRRKMSEFVMLGPRSLAARFLTTPFAWHVCRTICRCAPSGPPPTSSNLRKRQR